MRNRTRMKREMERHITYTLWAVVVALIYFVIIEVLTQYI